MAIWLGCDQNSAMIVATILPMGGCYMQYYVMAGHQRGRYRRLFLANTCSSLFLPENQLTVYL